MIPYQPWLLEIKLPLGATRIKKVIVNYDKGRDEDWHAEVPVVRAAPDTFFPKPPAAPELLEAAKDARAALAVLYRSADTAQHKALLKLDAAVVKAESVSSPLAVPEGQATPARVEEVLQVTWRVIPPAPWMNYDETLDKWAVVTNGKWGSENTPVVLGHLPKAIAEHCVALHNASFKEADPKTEASPDMLAKVSAVGDAADTSNFSQGLLNARLASAAEVEIEALALSTTRKIRDLFRYGWSEVEDTQVAGFVLHALQAALATMAQRVAALEGDLNVALGQFRWCAKQLEHKDQLLQAAEQSLAARDAEIAGLSHPSEEQFDAGARSLGNTFRMDNQHMRAKLCFEAILRGSEPIPTNAARQSPQTAEKGGEGK